MFFLKYDINKKNRVDKSNIIELYTNNNKSRKYKVKIIYSLYKRKIRGRLTKRILLSGY